MCDTFEYFHRISACKLLDFADVFREQCKLSVSLIMSLGCLCGHEKNNLHGKRVCGSRTEAFFAIQHL